MKKIRNTASFLLSTVLMTSLLLSGCSSSSNEGNQDESNNNSPTNKNNTEETRSAKEPLGMYDPPIEVSVIRPYDENTKFVNGDTADNNEWSRLYAEKLGINVKYAWTFQGSGDQYIQKLNVAIASNDLADVVMVTGNQLKQLVEADQIEDLTSVFDQSASDFLKKSLNEDGGPALKSATFDGKLMALPRIGSDIDEVPLLWIRTDWLKKLNLPEPKTMEDVYAISKAFTTMDPDGNNKADTIGLGLNKDLSGGVAGIEGFLNGHHAYLNTWLEDGNGKLVFSNIQPEMKNALAKLQSMYANKEIDKEFGTKDGGKVGESISNSKLGMYYGAMWTPLWPLQSGKELDPEMEWTPFMLPSIDDKPAKGQLPFQVSQYYVVKKGSQHPEASVKMMNLWYDVAFDTVYKPETYYATPDGVEIFKHAILSGAPITVNMDKYKEMSRALETKDDSFMKANFVPEFQQVKAFVEKGDIKGWGMHRVFGPGGSFSVIDQYVAQDRLLRTKFFSAPTPAMGEKGGTLDTLMKETFTKIIMGAAPIDEFDNFVENWKKLGGDEITAEVNEWYAQQ